jgi:hypothetical protein
LATTTNSFLAEPPKVEESKDKLIMKECKHVHYGRDDRSGLSGVKPRNTLLGRLLLTVISRFVRRVLLDSTHD